MHLKYFKMIGLSDEGAAELTRIVSGFYDKISAQNEPLQRTVHIQFADKQDFLDKHQAWIKAIGVSERTRAELKVVLANLYDKIQSGAKDPVMEELTKMMKRFNGMPPCCSQDAVNRATQ